MWKGVHVWCLQGHLTRIFGSWPTYNLWPYFRVYANISLKQCWSQMLVTAAQSSSEIQCLWLLTEICGCDMLAVIGWYWPYDSGSGETGRAGRYGPYWSISIFTMTITCGRTNIGSHFRTLGVSLGWYLFRWWKRFVVVPVLVGTNRRHILQTICASSLLRYPNHNHIIDLVLHFLSTTLCGMKWACTLTCKPKAADWLAVVVLISAVRSIHIE